MNILVAHMSLRAQVQQPQAPGAGHRRAFDAVLERQRIRQAPRGPSSAQ